MYQGVRISTSIGTGLNSNTNNGSNPNPMQNLNFYPSGSTTISLQNGSTKKEQTTYATIGNGTINLNGTTLTTADIAANPELAALNRDVTKSQIITTDQITGALDASITLDNRLFTSDGRTQMANEQRNLPTNLLTATGQQIDLAKKAWASPNTAIGLTIGAAGYLYGSATGQDVDVRMGENAIQFVGVPFGGGALTLGNAENYFDKASPERIWPTYESNNSSWSMGASYDSVVLGGHEVKHTYQAEILGPFFLPTYFLAGVGGAAVNGVITLNPVNKYNPMEREADSAGNQSLKQLRNEN